MLINATKLLTLGGADAADVVDRQQPVTSC